ncbi:MAG: hypothetical protein GY737_20460 [Desulfobacteraceae bacterium]|nr:hypothetical protein [Desulfobacteraceae bacterium]
MKRLIAVSVMMFFMVACATHDQRARTESTAAGAGIGAALGAGLGYLLGEKEGAVVGAVIGATVGGAAGYSYADSITKRQKELERKENNLDARINFARGVNEDTLKYNQDLEKQIRIREANIEKMTQKAEQQALEKEIRTAEQNKALLKNGIEDLKNFQANQPQVSDELDAEIAELEKNLARLKSNTSKLASLRHRF